MPKRIRKALGVVGKLMSIVPDTTEIIGKRLITVDQLSKNVWNKNMKKRCNYAR